jgi:hypothetical protein
MKTAMTAEQKRALSEVLTIDKEVMHGTPCFADTRVPVQTLIDFLETGETVACVPGIKASTPNPAKSFTFRVTTTNPCSTAVAAISPSAILIVLPCASFFPRPNGPFARQSLR